MKKEKRVKEQIPAPDREYWIDAVRSFACLCVITTHAPIPHCGGGAPLIAVTNYYAVAGASILFFMISGALVLYKEKPVVSFLKTRLSRIVLPMVIWSVICLIIDYFLKEISGTELTRKILMIPFGPQVGTYWFIYVIFGIYLVAQPIASWLSRCSRKDVELYLGIWSITLLLPYLTAICPDFNVIVGYRSGYLYYFYGFLGFAVLGYYLRKYVSIPKIKWVHIIIIVLLLVFPWILYLFPSIPHSAIQNRMAINVVAMSVIYFLVLKHIKWTNRMKRICYDFANHSFGIYLVHLLVMRKVLWPILEPLQLHYAIQIPLVVILTAVLSYLVVHLISKLPYSKYIIGL
jgi:surface polysaccharide O-acyltransferase-like enzyme